MRHEDGTAMVAEVQGGGGGEVRVRGDHRREVVHHVVHGGDAVGDQAWAVPEERSDDSSDSQEA